MTPSLFKLPPDPRVVLEIERKLLRKDRGESGKRLLTEEECEIYAQYWESKNHFKSAEFFSDKDKK